MYRTTLLGLRFETRGHPESVAGGTQAGGIHSLPKAICVDLRTSFVHAELGIASKKSGIYRAAQREQSRGLAEVESTHRCHCIPAQLLLQKLFEPSEWRASLFFAIYAYKTFEVHMI